MVKELGHMRPALCLSLSILTIFTLLSTTSADPIPRPLVADDLIRSLPHFSGVASLQIDGEETLFLSAGTADARSDEKHGRNTRFAICSLSKQFAAVAVMTLVDRSHVDLDAPLHTYVNGLKPQTLNGKTCTVRQALNHLCGFEGSVSTGMQHHLQDQSARSAFLDAVNETPLRHTPGSKRKYSNVGYNLLGLLVTDLSGQSYEMFLRKTFFEPLGMMNTGITHAESAPGHARGLIWLKWFSSDAPTMLAHASNYASTLGAAGNLYSTVDDLHRWNHALHSGNVLSKKGLKALKTVPPVSLRTMDNKSGGYAGGIIVHRYPNGTEFVWHNGALLPYGFTTFMGYVPDTKTSLVLLSNHMNFVNPLTALGLNLLERQHDIIKDVPPTELSLWAYLFPVLIGAILISFPLLLWRFVSLYRRASPKGHVKGFQALLNHACFTPYVPLMIWGTPTNGVIVFTLFGLAAGTILWRRYPFFETALTPIKTKTIARQLGVHLVTLLAVGLVDPLGCLFMSVNLVGVTGLLLFKRRMVATQTTH